MTNRTVAFAVMAFSLMDSSEGRGQEWKAQRCAETGARLARLKTEAARRDGPGAKADAWNAMIASRNALQPVNKIIARLKTGELALRDSVTGEAIDQVIDSNWPAGHPDHQYYEWRAATNPEAFLEETRGTLEADVNEKARVFREWEADRGRLGIEISNLEDIRASLGCEGQAPPADLPSRETTALPSSIPWNAAGWPVFTPELLDRYMQVRNAVRSGASGSLFGLTREEFQCTHGKVLLHFDRILSSTSDAGAALSDAERQILRAAGARAQARWGFGFNSFRQGEMDQLSALTRAGLPRDGYVTAESKRYRCYGGQGTAVEAGATENPHPPTGVEAPVGIVPPADPVERPGIDPGDPMSSQGVALPSGGWEISESTGWVGTWSPRADGRYVADWTRGSGTARELLAISVVGDRVTARAIESSNNSRCTYVGTLRGSTITGSYTCAGVRGGPWTWSARLRSLPSMLRVTESTGWSAEWRRRGSSSLYDSRWQRGSERASEVLEITRTGDRVTARAVESSNNSQCTYTGTVRGERMSGSYTCAGVRGGPWRWEAVADARLPAEIIPPGGFPPDDIAVNVGTEWQVTESTGWTGRFRLRGAGVWDSEWTKGSSRATEVLELTLTGEGVVLRARESSNNSQCTYTGAIQGRRVRGTYTCANIRGGPWTWEATIR